MLHTVTRIQGKVYLVLYQGLCTSIYRVVMSQTVTRIQGKVYLVLYQGLCSRY